MKHPYEKMLDEFIEFESWKLRTGSGDDQFYVDQLKEYINKQRPLWLTALEHFAKQRDWYKQRIETLTIAQTRFRDSERTMLCDIIANGKLLEDGNRRPEKVRYQCDDHFQAKGEPCNDRCIIENTDANKGAN